MEIFHCKNTKFGIIPTIFKEFMLLFFSKQLTLPTMSHYQKHIQSTKKQIFKNYKNTISVNKT